MHVDAIQEDVCKPEGRLISFRLHFPYDTLCFCISGFLPLNIPPSSSLAWLEAFPQSHLISKLHTTTRLHWTNFGCHFHYQDNGTTFCYHCASILHPIQIACVVLEIARTKVWMTFFEIWIESSSIKIFRKSRINGEKITRKRAVSQISAKAVLK